MTGKPGDSDRTEDRDLPGPDQGRSRGVPATLRLIVAAVVGMVVGVTLALLSDWRYGILVGWMSATLLFLTWMWSTLAPMDAARTADHAVRDNPNHATTDLAVLAACLASVVAVGFLALRD